MISTGTLRSHSLANVRSLENVPSFVGFLVKALASWLGNGDEPRADVGVSIVMKWLCYGEYSEMRAVMVVVSSPGKINCSMAYQCRHEVIDRSCSS